MTDRPTVLVEDQDRPLIWTGGLDPDPLNPISVDDAYEQGYVDGIAHSVALDAARKRRRDHLGIVAVLAAAAALLIVGYAAGRAFAAPRSGQTTERVDVSAPSSAALSGAPLPAIPAAAQQETAQPGRVASGNPASGAPASTIASGLVAYAAPSFGERYLALPAGPGIRVRICASISRLCLERISTDAGPARSMQRAGRIADVSFADFAWLCRCDPPDVGLLEATIEYSSRPGLTPPPTSVGP